MLWQDPSFDSVKGQIARYESHYGKYRLHVNRNMTLDCGLYQINSVHFSGKSRIAVEFNRIFKKYKVGEALHDRVVAAIVNDRLNEELARKLYQLKGLKSWTSSRKFINKKPSINIKHNEHGLN